MKKPQVDEWIETGLVAFGAVGTILGIGTYLGARFETLLAFVAGGGWTLVIALLILIKRERHRIVELETEIAEERLRSGEWRIIAMNDSNSLNRFIERGITAPKAQARTTNRRANSRTSEAE